MRPLPPKGLIVSCYLESMAGCEKAFISAVARAPGVVALRVEGLENIRYARMIAPEMYIIGLAKVRRAGLVLITPDADLGQAILDVGADMVAGERVWHDCGRPFMWDLDQCPDEECFWGSMPPQLILATTFIPKAFDLVREMKTHFPDIPVNLEGGIETAEEVQRGFDCGADYVTIGKAINDPPTIINRLVTETTIMRMNE